MPKPRRPPQQIESNAEGTRPGSPRGGPAEAGFLVLVAAGTSGSVAASQNEKKSSPIGAKLLPEQDREDGDRIALLRWTRFC